MIVHKTSIAAIAASFFLIGCASGSFIKEPIVMKASQWQLEIKELYADTELLKSTGTGVDAGEMTNNLLGEMRQQPGIGRYQAGSIAEVNELKRKVADKYFYIVGETIRTNYGLGYVIAPSHKDLAFVRMKIRVANTGSKNGEFDFDRVRLLFPIYVAQPVAISTPKLIGSTTATVTLKPGEDAIRTLIFVHFKDTRPYKLAYDRIVGNRVSDKIVIKMPQVSAVSTDSTY